MACDAAAAAPCSVTRRDVVQMRIILGDGQFKILLDDEQGIAANAYRLLARVPQVLAARPPAPASPRAEAEGAHTGDAADVHVLRRAPLDTAEPAEPQQTVEELRGELDALRAQVDELRASVAEATRLLRRLAREDNARE